MNILAFHIETTGLSLSDDEIVSIALCSCDEDFNIKNELLVYRNDIEDKKVKEGYKYNKIGIEFLRVNGLDKESFAEEILTFIVKEFDLEKPIHLLGYNISMFSKPFFMKLLEDFDVELPLSSNLLDAYPVAVTILGNTSIKELLELFSTKTDFAREEIVMQKCLTFVNIFKRVRKLWNRKVLNKN